jgi:hypothetical protein
MKQLLDQIKAAADQAQDIIDYTAAHDEEIIFAIEIVEKFLRRTHRICYGGQAINTYLPEKHKFYDPLKSIPDYDFLTPTGESDIKELVRRFKEAGFVEIGVRPGMHEGTTKLYINYTAVADITEIHPEFYRRLYERSNMIDGIQYIDVNSLRMMMYLELSRPKGEVGRWEKVFERLELLNMYVPIKCEKRTGTRVHDKKANHITERKQLIDFIIYEQRVLVGADLSSFYKSRLKKQIKIDWFINKHQPLLFYSPIAEADASLLKKQLERHSHNISLEVVPSQAEFFPKVVLIRINGVIIAGIVQETACHAYNTVELSSGRTLRIGSLDTLITLFISLTFQKEMDELFENSILCVVQQLIELQNLYRTSSKKIFPFISLECSGHQKQLSSLLREKVERIRAARGARTRTASRTRRPESVRNITVKKRRSAVRMGAATSAVTRTATTVKN